MIGIIILAALILAFILWIVYLIRGRANPWAFPLWLPLTVLAGYGTFYWAYLGICMTKFRRGGGAEEGLFQMGVMFEFGILSVAPILLAISLWLRPRKEAYNRKTISATLIGVTVFFTGIFLVVQTTFNTPLELEITQPLPDKITRRGIEQFPDKPLAGVAIRYQAFFPELLIPIGFLRTGSVVTDEKGHATIWTSRRMGLIAKIREPGLEEYDLLLPAGGHDAWLGGTRSRPAFSLWWTSYGFHFASVPLSHGSIKLRIYPKRPSPHRG